MKNLSYSIKVIVTGLTIAFFVGGLASCQSQSSKNHYAWLEYAQKFNENKAKGITGVNCYHCGELVVYVSKHSIKCSKTAK